MADDKPDDRVSLKGLEPIAALRALLAVDPDAPPADAKGKDDPQQMPAQADDAK